MSVVNENIRRIRMARNMKQSELAQKIGISQNYLSQIEKGVRKISLELLDKISVAFGLTPSDLLEENRPMANFDDMGEVLKWIREKKQISAETIAQKVGEKPETIIEWERNSNAIDAAKLKELVRALGTTLDYIYGETDDPSPEPALVAPNEATLRSPTQHNMVRIKMLPKDYKICCGQGIAYLDDTVEIDHEMLLMDEELARYYSTADLYGICVDGDSMEPYIPDGATVVITTNFDTLYSGDVAVINYNGRQIVRGFIERGRSQEVILRAHNKDYDDIVVTPDDDLCICGKVLRVISSIKPRSVI